jgi:hypothetical protein
LNYRAATHERLIMLKWLKRWLGWDSASSLFDFSDLQSKPPSRPLPPIMPRTPSPPKGASGHPANPAPRPKPKERTPADILNNPRLTLDKPADDGFDPYNTGAFNRSTSWEKIGRQRKR